MSLRKIAIRAPRLLATALAAVALFTNIHADTIPVTSLADDGSPGTLRAALAIAVDGDVIDARGISGTILLTAGNLLIQDSVAILGPGAASLSVDGNHLSGVFFITAGHTITIDGISIVNGDAAGSGGGIFNQSSLTVSNCTLSGNSGNFGGGIVNRLSPLTVINCTITDNSARIDGGGIYNDGSAAGGNAMLSVFNSTISDNSADNFGGGIFNFGRDSGSATMTIVSSTLNANEAFVGGGIFSDGFAGSASAAVVNCTLSSNIAVTGGAIVNLGSAVNNGADSRMKVVGCTLNGNFGTAQVGGIFSAGATEVGNTILKDGAGGSLDGTIVSFGFNLSSDAAGGDASAGPGGFLIHVSDRRNTDPMLGPLADNGGPTHTHLPLLGSPAIDGGSSDALLGMTEDQRGFARNVDDPFLANAFGGDGTDIGAVEIAAAPPPPPPVPVADVGIMFLGADKVSVKQGEVLTYTIAIRNFGPNTAPNVVVNDLMSSGTGFLNARATKGSFVAPPTNESGAVVWTIGDMANGTAEGAELTVSVLVKGKTTVTNLATVQSDADDPNAENNVASITTSVAAGGNSGGGKKK